MITDEKLKSSQKEVEVLEKDKTIKSYNNKHHQKQIKKNNKGNKNIERLNTQRSEYSDFYFDKTLELRFIEESMASLPTV